MNTDPRLEQRVTAALNRAAATHEPDGLLDSVLSTVGRTRTRPRWLALIKEPPMRIHSHIAVGSPTARLAYLFLLVLLLTIVATGAVVAGASLAPTTPAIVVAQDGTGNFRTITEAVAVAADGDTILVKPGTYLGSVAITEDITLRGDGDRKAVILEFAADGPTHPWAEDGGMFPYGILLDDSNARIEDLTVRGPGAGAAFVIEGGAPVIDGIDIVLEAPADEWYYKRNAFRIQGGSTAEIRDSTWDAYTRVSGAGSSARFEGNTIRVQIIAIGSSGAKATIVGNTLLDDAGILFAEYGSSAIVEDNDIDGSLGGNIGDGTVIRGNRIRHGFQAGAGERGSAIQLAGTGSAVVEKNEISDTQYGIDVSAFGAKPRISGNTIRGSTVAAIGVIRGAAPTIDGNTIEKNATGIEVLGVADPVQSPVISGNTLCGNGTDLVVPDGSTLTLDGNTVCAEGSAAP